MTFGPIETSFTRPDGRVFNLSRRREDYASFETYYDDLYSTGYAEGGLWIEKGRLEDYDGIFALPLEVVRWLRDQGVVVPKECY